MTSDPTIRLRFTYVLDDFTGNFRGPLEAGIPWRWTQLILWALVIGGAVALFRFLGKPAQSANTSFRPGDLFTVIISVIVPFAFYSLSRAVNHFRTHKAWRQNPQSPITLTFSDAGLAWESQTGTGERLWIAFRFASESPKCFLLHPLEGGDICIPKRVMTADQISTLRTLLQSVIVDNRGFPVQLADSSTPNPDHPTPKP